MPSEDNIPSAPPAYSGSVSGVPASDVAIDPNNAGRINAEGPGSSAAPMVNSPYRYSDLLTA